MTKITERVSNKLGRKILSKKIAGELLEVYHKEGYGITLISNGRIVNPDEPLDSDKFARLLLGNAA